MESIEKYRVFFYVANYQSFSRAANIMGISQPAITKTITQLEESLGHPLFNRDLRPIELTEKGKILYDYVSHALHNLMTAEEVVMQDDAIISNILRVHMCDFSSRSYIFDRIGDFVLEYNCKIHLNTAENAETAMHKLESGLYDIMLFVTLGEVSLAHTKNIEVFKIFSSPMKFIVGDEYYRRIGDRPVTPEEINKMPCIVLPRDSKLVQGMAAWFADRDIQLNADIVASNPEMAIRLAAHNAGVTATNLTNLHSEDFDDLGIHVLNVTEEAPNAEYYVAFNKSMHHPKVFNEILATHGHKFIPESKLKNYEAMVMRKMMDHDGLDDPFADFRE